MEVPWSRGKKKEKALQKKKNNKNTYFSTIEHEKK